MPFSSGTATISDCMTSAAAVAVANWVPATRTFAAASRIELVPTPTYASHLNPVGCHFSALRPFAVCSADYLDRDACGDLDAVARCKPAVTRITATAFLRLPP
ncbi:MAG: hypothetical protein U0R69_02050 [Gaiellales bacterium]